MGLEARLSALRKEKKISQQELAELAGIHPNVLGRYERGEASPSVEMASKLSNATDVSLDYLEKKTVLSLMDAYITKTKIQTSLHSK